MVIKLALLSLRQRFFIKDDVVAEVSHNATSIWDQGFNMPAAVWSPCLTDKPWLNNEMKGSS